MKKLIMPIIAAAMLLVSTPVKATQNKIQFDDNTRYSQLIINSNLYHYHCNTSRLGGLGKYNASTEEVGAGEYVDTQNKSTCSTSDHSKHQGRGFDYVPGLVVKATLEAIDLYAKTEMNSDAYSWFKSVEQYADTYYNNEHSGGSLDDLNACKIYFGLYDLTKASGQYPNTTTASNCQTAKNKALVGLSNHNTSASILAATSQTYANTFAATKAYTNLDFFAGGWWHKDPDYPNQLWCDGQYMGPALLAMMVADSLYISGSDDDDWAIIMKQFTMCWDRLWDSDKKLLYHAFSADPTSTQALAWADQNHSITTRQDGTTYDHYGVSAEYWGRAEGWYFLALVDVLECMQKAGKVDADYITLKNQLEAVADGLLARQDAETGCWCQLLQYGKDVNPTGCSTKNYIESTATGIFVATYLKAIRLGLLDRAKYEAAAVKGYKGFVENFIVKNTNNEDGDNAYSVVGGCASAGVSSDRDGTASYYLAEYTTGRKLDAVKITNYTEGKALGAFILAAVEYEKAYWRYNVTYDMNGHGNQLQPSKVAIKADASTLSTPEDVSGYVFGGWYTDQECTNPVVRITGDCTLYAKWTLSCSVTYNCNGATSGCPENLTEQTNLPETLPTPQKTGFSFGGWFTDENCTQAATAGAALTENVNLYAKWTALYTINVSSNNAEYGTISKATIADVPDGTAISWNGNTFTVNEQQVTATAETNTAQYSYEFTGWSSQPTTVDGNLDLVANFTRTTNQYTITFDMQGHGDQVAQQVKDYGAVVAQPTAPTASGYRFDGWYAEAACQNAWDFATTITGNVTLYAKWTRVYTITYVTEGELDQSAWVKSYTGEQAVALPTPERSGYEFLGWYENSQKVTSIPQGSTGDKTFTAEWIETCNYLRVIE